MIIKSATASFGKLQNDTLSFHPGLNIIKAPNESGKSTWCAFIRAMLYGIDSAQRSKAGSLPDKQKYAPWSGAPMEGTMDIESDGVAITLRRSTRQQNAPMRVFSATYTGTNTPVEELTGENAGPVLTGAGKEVFRRSAFMEQGSLALTESKELERRITAIVSTGEENISFSEADKKLRDELNGRRNAKGGGTLPKLEIELDEAQLKLEKIKEGNRQIRALEQNLERENRSCVELEEKKHQARAKEKQQALNTYQEGCRALEAGRIRLDNAREKLAEKKRDLEEGSLGFVSAEEAQQSVGKDMERINYLEALAHGKSVVSAVPFLMCLVMAAACATIYIEKQIIYLAISAVLMLGFGLFLLLRWFSAGNKVKSSLLEEKQLLKKYRAGDASDIEALLERHCGLWDEYEKALEAARFANEDYILCQSNAEELQTRAMEALNFSVEGSGEAAALARAQKEKRLHIKELSYELAELRGRIDSFGDEQDVRSSIEFLENKYNRAADEYDAIELALNTLQEADTELQNRFSPKLSSLAAEYMSELTGGKYDKLMISKDFKAAAQTGSDVTAHETAYLSAGTADLLYLALRLAVCALTLPEGESCPLIIDDALVNLDEERSARAMKLLEKLSEDRQIILFTCK